MRRSWSGTDGHRLPAKKVEPYRLWFEFLKHAAKDKTLTINDAFYAPWGDYRSQTFNTWWGGHWRSLFSVDIGVRIVSSEAELHNNDKQTILLRVPRYQSKQKTLREISVLLEEIANDRLSNMPSGQFHLDCGTDRKGEPIDPSIRFLRNLDKVRLLMHLYRFRLQHDALDDKTRIEETAKSYFTWASAWNTKVREKKWKRPTIEIPPAIQTYCEFLEQRGSRRRTRLYEQNDANWNAARSQIVRYIRKARRLAANTASGQFPGQYE